MGASTLAPGSGEAVPSSLSSGAAAQATTDAAIKAAFDRVMSAPTPSARAEANAELERLYERKAASSPPPEQAEEGLQIDATAPRSPLEYKFAAPPGMEITDEVEGGELRAALFEAGVPTGLANQAFVNAAHLHASGVRIDDAQAYDAAVVKCRQALDKRFGADASTVAREGAAYLNALGDRSAALREPMTLLLADPFAVAAAANLARMKWR